jgi:class 3 adenylate cyclase
VAATQTSYCTGRRNCSPFFKEAGRNRVFVDPTVMGRKCESASSQLDGDLSSRPSKPSPAVKRKIALIAAADVGYYFLLVATEEEGTLRLLSVYREVFEDFVRRYDGRVYNTAGDSVMTEFSSAVEAVRAAIDIQEVLRTRNAAYPSDRRLQFRIRITVADAWSAMASSTARVNLTAREPGREQRHLRFAGGA